MNTANVISANNRTCFFCDSPAKSREHVWPDWLLKTMPNRKPLRQTLLSGDTREFAGDFKIKCVCRPCNNGWMSRLETGMKPLLGTLAADLSVSLDIEQQRNLSRWAIKTAMVVEGTKPQGTSQIYGPKSRQALRTTGAIPDQVFVWIGRNQERGLYAAASDIQYAMSAPARSGHANVTTLVVGHLVFQVFYLEVDLPRGPNDFIAEVPYRDGNWDETLLPIQPPTRRLLWPPKHSFGGDVDVSPLTALRDKWRVEP